METTTLIHAQTYFVNQFFPHITWNNCHHCRQEHTMAEYTELNQLLWVPLLALENRAVKLRQSQASWKKTPCV